MVFGCATGGGAPATEKSMAILPARMWILAEQSGGAGDEARDAVRASTVRVYARIYSSAELANMSFAEGGPRSEERSECELLALSSRGRGPVKGRGSSRRENERSKRDEGDYAGACEMSNIRTGRMWRAVRATWE